MNCQFEGPVDESFIGRVSKIDDDVTGGVTGYAKECLGEFLSCASKPCGRDGQEEVAERVAVEFFGKLAAHGGVDGNDM